MSSPAVARAVTEHSDHSAPYAGQPMILRDYLATDRTGMANERLLLAYIRTALAALGGGAAVVQFGHGAWSILAGATLAGSAAWVSWLGYRRYRRTDRMLRAIRATSRSRSVPREG